MKVSVAAGSTARNIREQFAFKVNQFIANFLQPFKVVCGDNRSALTLISTSHQAFG